jgi:DNA-directed RNA polymerase subunit RPC12/RpoP
MAAKELKCPTCDGDLLLSGDESEGDQIYCPTCASPAVLKGAPGSDDCEPESDY